VYGLSRHGSRDLEPRRSTVTCPWCEGSGLRPAEIDAQAHWAREGGEAPPGGEAAGTEPGAT
jgi:hypothetical protein